MLRRECHHVGPGPRAPRLRASTALALALCAASPGGATPAPQSPPPPSYRLFLTDGTPLVSCGEVARVDGSVVFTIPIGPPSNPDGLYTASLPDSVIDWSRTDRYTDTVRHQTYGATRGEEDYAALTGAVARALGDIAFAADPSSKLAIAADIRRQLLEWPAAHYAYRAADVRDLTAHVEEVVSQIRAGSGHQSFDLSLVATVEPPEEPLLPEPTLQEAIDYAVTIAHRTDRPRDRLTLQENILAVLDRRKREVPGSWYAATRRVLARSVDRERGLDRDYSNLVSRTLRDARKLEARADVETLERLADGARTEDGRLGRQRPGAMQALFQSLADSAGRAKAKRAAMARHAYRSSTYGEYRRRIGDSLEKFDDVAGDIVAVKALKLLRGRRLSRAEARVSAIEVSLLPLTPPAELGAAHDLLLSSARLMREALRLQRISTGGRDAGTVQNASAAAAGALLLLDAARSRVGEFFGKPASP